MSEADVHERQQLRRRSDALCRISGIVKSHLEGDPEGLTVSKATVLERIQEEVRAAIPELFEGSVDQPDGFATAEALSSRRPKSLSTTREIVAAICLDCNGKKWKSETTAARHAKEHGHIVFVTEKRRTLYGPREKWIQFLHSRKDGPS